MASWISRAFLLRVVPYREADLVVDLLTLDRGRLPALARGARKSRRRFGGVLDYFHLLEVQLRTGRGGMGTLQGAALVRSWPALQQDLDAYWVASHVLEVTRLGSREGDPDAGLYRLIEASFEALEAGAHRPSLAQVFQIKALGVLGYAPSFEGCPRCGALLRERGAAQWVGRVACPPCSPVGAPPLSAGALRTLQAASERSLQRLASLRISTAVSSELTPFLDEALTEALGQKPKSLASMPGRR